MTHSPKYVVTLFAVFCCSCVNDVDFNQAKNIQISPVVESDIFYFNIPSSRLIDTNNNPVTTIQDYSDMNLFNDEFISDNLKKAILTFEFTNDIDRTFQAKVIFLDAADSALKTIELTVTNGTTSNPKVATTIVTYENDDIVALKQAKKARLAMTISGGSSSISQNPGSLKLHSKGIFYMQIDTEN